MSCPTRISTSGVTFSAQEATSVLDMVNSAALAQLDQEVGLNARAAKNIVAARPIKTLAALDTVSYVGTAALKLLKAHVHGGPSARLLSGAHGIHKHPGQVRRSHNGIGGTRPGNVVFVPPPPHRLGELLSDFERAVHDHSDLPPLVRIGLLHAQFETLHPYLDGNGRLGRLLITLQLRHFWLLSRPLLYRSLFLAPRRPGCAPPSR